MLVGNSRNKMDNLPMTQAESIMLVPAMLLAMIATSLLG